ncbi:MAG: serine/threonine-protein kinase [Planctomycetota bacterium]|nr:serine/threonine-protein kinase [Planctomycetota bacterium]
MTIESTGPGDSLQILGDHYRSLVGGGLVGWDASRPFLKCLGIGGQGVVYLSERRGVDGFTIPVALKVFSPDRFTDRGEYAIEMARLAGVASRVARIQQDHLVDVQNVVSDQGIHVLEMEWVDGYDLRRLMTPDAYGHIREQVTERRWQTINQVVMTEGPQQPRLRPGTAASVIRECLAALAAMHRHGIVHNDIKPSNVMLKRSGNVKIIDIGAAFELENRPPVQPCTPIYAAPEVLEGKPGTPASDLASIGYMLIEMLSGEQPFSQMKYAEMLTAKRAVFDWLPGMLPVDEFAMTEPLLRLLRGLVNPDPLGRFPSAEEAELDSGGVAEFQRELVQAGVTSEYEAEIRHWIDEVEAEFELHAPSDEATGDFLPPTRVFNPKAELDD